MQDEVNTKVVAIAIRGSKITEKRNRYQKVII